MVSRFLFFVNAAIVNSYLCSRAQRSYFQDFLVSWDPIKGLFEFSLRAVPKFDVLLTP